jgi:hypothetical protein
MALEGKRLFKQCNICGYQGYILIVLGKPNWLPNLLSPYAIVKLLCVNIISSPRVHFLSSKNLAILQEETVVLCSTERTAVSFRLKT